MKIRVLGGGFYGCHIAKSLLTDGHDVHLYEKSERLFSGASGNNPARLHIGPHYPRSAATRAACLAHYRAFMDEYGQFTRAVPTNLYAIAKHDSLLDFATYTQILRSEIEFMVAERPAEYGLRHVEGAILCGERHIVIDEVRRHFESALEDAYSVNCEQPADNDADLVIDCTFCAREAAGVERYEPCLIALLSAPTDKAVTIMDGPFASLYPWSKGLCSLSSARFTPFSKEVRTYEEARALLDGLTKADIERQGERMIESLAHFYPTVRDYGVADYRLSIRAMPRSAADARLIDVVPIGDKTIRLRAGKIAMISEAARAVRHVISSGRLAA